MGFISALVQIGLSPQQAKHLGEDATLAASATGNNSQANAYQIATSVAEFSTVTAAANSAKLPQAVGWPKGTVIVTNTDSADVLYVFPYSGDSINSLSADTAITLNPGSTAFFTAVSSTRWLCVIEYKTRWYYLSGSGAITYGTAGTFVTITSMSQSVTLTGDEAIFVIGAASVSNDSLNGNMQLRLRRDTTVISMIGHNESSEASAAGQIKTCTIFALESPGAGTYTYDFQAALGAGSAGSGYVDKRALGIIIFRDA